MKKNLRKYSALFILLVLTTNISFSVTFSYCSMNMKSTACKCDTDSRKYDSHISKIPCCTTETIFISNNADFENNSNIRDNITDSKFIQIYDETHTYELNYTVSDFTRLIFYSPPSDVPVMNSSLLI